MVQTGHLIGLEVASLLQHEMLADDRSGVKSGKAQSEHNISALPPKADIAADIVFVRSVPPEADIGQAS
jgi:hypothetical protein